MLDLARENFACLTSYVVGANSRERVLAFYRAELENGPAKPVDLFLRDCVADGRLRAGLLFPFVTSFRLDEVAPSTIAAGTNAAKPSVIVLAVLRVISFSSRAQISITRRRVSMPPRNEIGGRPIPTTP